MQEVAGFHDPCHLIESWSRTVYKTVGLIWRWNRANPQVSAKDTEAIWAQAFMAALLACDGKLSILKVVDVGSPAVGSNCQRLSNPTLTRNVGMVHVWCLG